MPDLDIVVLSVQTMMTTTTQETPAPAPDPVAEPVTERVTKPEDPKKVAAGRAGAADRKAKQERLLKQLRGIKENLRDTDGDGTSAKEAESIVSVAEQREQRQQEHTDNQPEKTNWTPWIIGACLADGAIAFVAAPQRKNTRLRVSRNAQATGSAA